MKGIFFMFEFLFEISYIYMLNYYKKINSTLIVFLNKIQTQNESKMKIVSLLFLISLINT